MIIGIGCDIVQIPRIKKIYNANKDRFLNRIFSDVEIEQLPDISEIEAFIAKRYAAKEAFSKAVGYGIGSVFRFKDIEIFKDIESGKPYFSEQTLKKVGTNVIGHISLSDDYPTAIAYVLLCTS
jgi:holo-[acyl-carrier protein] synthase